MLKNKKAKATEKFLHKHCVYIKYSKQMHVYTIYIYLWTLILYSHSINFHNHCNPFIHWFNYFIIFFGRIFQQGLFDSWKKLSNVCLVMFLTTACFLLKFFTDQIEKKFNRVQTGRTWWDLNNFGPNRIICFHSQLTILAWTTILQKSFPLWVYSILFLNASGNDECIMLAIFPKWSNQSTARIIPHHDYMIFQS